MWTSSHSLKKGCVSKLLIHTEDLQKYIFSHLQILVMFIIHNILKYKTKKGS